MHPAELPAEVLDDVASVIGAEVTLLARLPGGINSGAVRIQLAGRADAVLKAVPRTNPDQLSETLRAQRVVKHMRGRGYPTPAWLGVGSKGRTSPLSRCCSPCLATGSTPDCG